MADYKDLESLIGKLKRSAIDAYMRGNPINGGGGGWSIEGDHYVLSSASGGTAKVTRPGENGEGGGDWAHSSFLLEWFLDSGRDQEFTEAFGSIRARIDKAIAPWKDLPDPSGISTEVDECRVITRDLSGAADASNGTATGAGDIASAIGLMHENLDAMSGQTISTFKMKFLGKLGLAIGGMHAISLVHGAAIAGEQGIFEQTRRAVAEATDSARAACDAIAQSGGGNLKVALKIAEWAAKGASIFATGGVSATFEVPKLGIEMIQTVTSDEAFQREPSSHETALKAFEEALNKINHEVKRGEQALRDNLVKNLNQIRSDKSSYDLKLDAISSSEDVTIISKPLTDEIIYTYMPAIATGLDTTAENTLKVDMHSAVNRDGTVGIGVHGPSEKFAELNWLLYELLKDLSWEVTMGAKNLELAVAELMGTDADVRAKLNDITSKINTGSGVDPWD